VTADFEATAWSWVEHVRHGGSTPWHEWPAREHPPEPAARESRAPRSPGGLPGAAELELVRLLASRAPANLPPTAFTTLADLVLSRSGPGRGRGELALPWPVSPVGSSVDAPAGGPGAVPAEEVPGPQGAVRRPGHGVAPVG
jgi:hypothetical protein